MQEIKLAHHDDGKQKYQSHEISIFDKCDDYCDETGTFGIHDLAAIIGYGESEEQAREDFKNKFNPTGRIYPVHRMSFKQEKFIC